jgi:anthranilate phosphoribosyltransferase
MARALAELGSKHVLVVCGEDGNGGVLDEISTCGSTLLWELRDGTLKQHELSPEELGLRRCDVSALKGGDARQNASALLSVLSGEPGPRGDAVAANAGAALYVAGLAESIAAGVVTAQELLATGAAMNTLRALREAAE